MSLLQREAFEAVHKDVVPALWNKSSQFSPYICIYTLNSLFMIMARHILCSIVGMHRYQSACRCSSIAVRPSLL